MSIGYTRKRGQDEGFIFFPAISTSLLSVGEDLVSVLPDRPRTTNLHLSSDRCIFFFASTAACLHGEWAVGRLALARAKGFKAQCGATASLNATRAQVLAQGKRGQVKPPAHSFFSLDNETAGFVIMTRLARATDREPSSADRLFCRLFAFRAQRKANGKAASRTAEEGSGRPQHAQRGGVSKQSG